MADHTVKAFDNEIGQLRVLIAEMGGLAEVAIRDAIDALLRHDEAKAAAVTHVLPDSVTADCAVIGCDSIVAANKVTLAVMQPGRTFVALNTHGTPTASFVTNPNWQFPGGNCEAAVRASVGDALVGAFDAEQVAVQMLGGITKTTTMPVVHL